MKFFLNTVSNILRHSDKLSVVVANGAVSRRYRGWTLTYTSLKRTTDASGADAVRARGILECIEDLNLCEGPPSEV